MKKIYKHFYKLIFYLNVLINHKIFQYFENSLLQINILRSDETKITELIEDDYQIVSM